MAGKTGTVELPPTSELGGKEGNAAAWFVGYTPDLVGAVWLGYDQIDSTHFLPATVNGSTYPTAIWREAIGTALSGRPVLEFPGADGQVPPPPRIAEPPKPPARPAPVLLPTVHDLKADPGDQPGSVQLTWHATPTGPLPESVVFIVTRGTSPNFVVDQASLITAVTRLSFVDTPANPGIYFYRVAALDRASRQIGPAGTLGTQDPPAPAPPP